MQTRQLANGITSLFQKLVVMSDRSICHRFLFATLYRLNASTESLTVNCVCILIQTVDLLLMLVLKVFKTINRGNYSKISLIFLNLGYHLD